MEVAPASAASRGGSRWSRPAPRRRPAGGSRRSATYLGDDEAFCFTYGDGVAAIDVADRDRVPSSAHGKLATVTAVAPAGPLRCARVRRRDRGQPRPGFPREAGRRRRADQRRLLRRRIPRVLDLRRRTRRPCGSRNRSRSLAHDARTRRVSATTASGSRWIRLRDRTAIWRQLWDAEAARRGRSGRERRAASLPRSGGSWFLAKPASLPDRAYRVQGQLAGACG